MVFWIYVLLGVLTFSLAIGVLLGSFADYSSPEDEGEDKNKEEELYTFVSRSHPD